MKVLEAVSQVEEVREDVPRPLGLVPTMGALHRGHMTLVSRARSENASVCVSIFVNPTQFGPREDFGQYPRDPASDLDQLEQAGVDLVFAPPVDEMYPEGFGAFVEAGRVAERLEGESRPGHFRGVSTVVCKLLAITRPSRAYFGEKDAQQCLVVKRLNADLNLGAEIVVVPTVREADGLALSSRNAYLGPGERKTATVLYRSLCLAKELWGERDCRPVGGQGANAGDDRPRAARENRLHQHRRRREPRGTGAYRAADPGVAGRPGGRDEAHRQRDPLTTAPRRAATDLCYNVRPS